MTDDNRGPMRDIAGHPIGRPWDVVEVKQTQDVLRALELAATERRPLVAVGARTSYWQGLALENAVVLDLEQYARVLRFDEDTGVMTVQAGMTIRELDRQLRQRGYQLGMHQDSFGDSLVGAAISTGVTAGMGMMRGNFLDQVVGFEAVLPGGRVLQSGASRMSGRPGDGIGQGLPDLRSLFFGSEGTLGVLTEIDFALTPVRWEGAVEWNVPDDRIDEVLAFARRWRRRDLLDTARWVWDGSGTLSLFTSSSLDEADRDSRLARLAGAFPDWPTPEVTRFGEDHRAGRMPASQLKWRGPPGETWRRNERAAFYGLDAIVPWSAAAQAYRWARSVDVADARFVRVAMYFGSDGVNLGIHCVGPEPLRDASRTALEARHPELLELGAVPYRPGLMWRRNFLQEIDASTLEIIRAVSRELARSALNPGVGILSD